MLADSIKRLMSNLQMLVPYFSEDGNIDRNAESLGRFASSVMPVRMTALVRLGSSDGSDLRGLGIWYQKDVGQEDVQKERAAILRVFQEQVPAMVEQFGQEDIIENGALIQMLALPKEYPALLLPVWYQNDLCGMFLVQRASGEWMEEELEILSAFPKLLGAALNGQNCVENERLYSLVFNTVLDDMKVSIYVTDIETDQILFMNQTMKEDFGIAHPEGRICWQILQKNKTQRCSFCPVPALIESAESNPSCQWEENNEITGHAYRNYDSLIHWLDGRLVHIQQSVDETEIRTSNTDKLTQMMTRRPGKDALKSMLKKARREGTTITVCLYDINFLKEINDEFGHEQGDWLIAAIGNMIQSSLSPEEFAFRLSGDEFAVVFRQERFHVRRHLDRVLSRLKKESAAFQMSFSYGLVEVEPDQKLTVEEVLLLADERMYEQKQQFRILYNNVYSKPKQHTQEPVSFLYDKERLYDALVSSTDDYLYVCNMKTGIFRYTKAMVEEFDLPSEVIENAATVWGAKVHEEDRAAFLEANQEIVDGRSSGHCVEYRAINRHGEWVWLRCRGHLENDEYGKPVLFAGYITNLGKKNKFDHLTGLFNKLEWEEQIQYRIDNRMPFGIMLLGIDGMRHINELYDRTFGDEVIRIVSQKIQTFLPAGASVYRLDGDEFGVLLRSGSSKEMQDLYHTIQQMFAIQREYNDKKYYCTISAGCSRYPENTDTYLLLMKYAEYSLEYAKKNGRNRCIFYSEDILIKRHRSLEMTELLRTSLENNFEGFRLLYQPIVDAVDGRLIGMEALARWYCDAFGEVSPLEFIPLMEQTGMIIPLGKWAIQTAVRTCKQWNEQMPELKVNVNLTYLHLERPEFVLLLKDIVLKEQFHTENLVVEMTETTFAKEGERVRKIFDSLRDLGIRLAMDDFGTGYSALGVLKDMPVDIVKIDKIFLKDIKSSFGAALIRVIVNFCHVVGIKVCLEGVETEEEYELVKPMGVDMIQGFLFDRPLEKEAFRKKYFTES